MRNTVKFSLSLVLAFSILLVQVRGVFAVSDLQSSAPVGGITQSITLETDPTTGITTVIVDVMDSDQAVQSVRVSLESAIALGLVVLNGDGKPGINDLALGKPVEIDPSGIIPSDKDNQHPVGNALAAFFSDIDGIDYETIMIAYEQGNGFGAIAQTLWLTTKLEGDAEIFETLIQAKQSGDFSAFILEDGSTPANWGQLKKAILANNEKNGVGLVKSNSNKDGNGNGNNNGNGSGNGNGAGNGNSDGNKDNGDKDKNKDKDNGKGNDKKK